MYRSLHDFYKSDEWRALRAALIAERGYICEHCGKQIFKSIEAVGHHKMPLTLQNVNDATISLNPDNIMIVHLSCHNLIHEKFKYEYKKVYLVHGAPCAGKTSFVEQNKGRSDIVLDIDRIYSAITYLEPYDKNERLSQNVFKIRDCILDMVKMRTGKWTNAWVIGGYPFTAERERTAAMLGAECIHLAASREECIANLYADERRIQHRDVWEKYIDEYFLRAG